MPKVYEATAKGVINQEKIAAGVRIIFEAIGEDPNCEGLRDTATRVAKLDADVFQGLYYNPHDYLTVLFDAQHE